METIVTCVICKFWNNHSSDRRGDCHRYPPVMIKVDLNRWEAQHPQVEATDYCGEAEQDFKKYPEYKPNEKST